MRRIKKMGLQKLKFTYVYDNFEKLSYEEKKFVSSWYRRVAKNDFTRFMEKHDKGIIDDEEREKLLACAIKRKVKAFIDSNDIEKRVLDYINMFNNCFKFMDDDKEYMYLGKYTCKPDIVNIENGETIEVKSNKQLREDSYKIMFRTNHIDNIWATDMRCATSVAVVNGDTMKYIDFNKPFEIVDEHHYYAYLKPFAYTI